MQKLINNYSHFLIDLDNTIYLENDYLFQAYKKIALYIQYETGETYSSYENFLINEFNSKNRTGIFDKLIKKFNLKEDYIVSFLDILRTVKLEKKIEIYPEVFNFIELLKILNKSIYIVTNGNVAQQKNKISQIDWKGLDDKIEFIYANNYMPKPHKESFNLVFKKLDSLNKYVMIGDSKVDEEYAENCGIDFYHINKLRNRL